LDLCQYQHPHFNPLYDAHFSRGQVQRRILIIRVALVEGLVEKGWA